VAAAATQWPKGDRQHQPTNRFQPTHRLNELTRRRQHFHAFFLSTVFIQMSETLPVTKMTLNEQHCTMNKRFICQLFFGFRDNYTERLTCHHKEEKRHGGQKRRKRNCSTQRRKKKLRLERVKTWKRSLHHTNKTDVAYYTFTHISTLPK